MSQILITKSQGRTKHKGVIGLTDYCFGDPMCDKCTIPMSRSYWNDIQIFYSTSPKSNTGFYCVVCALKKGKTTIEELNKKCPKKETKQQPLNYSNGVT